MNNAIIVDLDGVVFNDNEFKKFLPIEKNQKTWSKFHEDVNYFKDMKINDDIITLVNMYMQNGYEVIFLTAREGLTRIIQNTYDSLDKVLTTKRYSLITRKIGDDRPDYLMKKDRYENYINLLFDVHLVIDDNKKNIEMFQALGLNTMLYKNKVEELIKI